LPIILKEVAESISMEVMGGGIGAVGAASVAAFEDGVGDDVGDGVGDDVGVSYVHPLWLWEHTVRPVCCTIASVSPGWPSRHVRLVELAQAFLLI
jgi:hypothetical protein